MKYNVEIQSIKKEDLPFLELMFGASKEDWIRASKSKEVIKPYLDTEPNDISHHINDLVYFGVKYLKSKKVIVSHIFFSSKYANGKEPFHTEHMDQRFIPKKGNKVTYDDSVLKLNLSSEISLDFEVENVNYRYEKNENNKLITFIDVILKSN